MQAFRGLERRECLAVEACGAIVRSDPDVALLILHDAAGHHVGEAILRGEVAEALSRSDRWVGAVADHTIAHCAEPEVALAVLECRNDVVGDLCGVHEHFLSRRYCNDRITRCGCRDLRVAGGHEHQRRKE